MKKSAWFISVLLSLYLLPCSRAAVPEGLEGYDPRNGFPPELDSPAGRSVAVSGAKPGAAPVPISDLTDESEAVNSEVSSDAVQSGSADGNGVALVAGEDAGLTQQIEGFNLVGYNDGGSKAWDIEGEKADIVGEKVEVTNVNANTYGETDMNLKAKTGVIDKATGDVQLNQDVVITSAEGARMTTDSLQWQRDKDKVQTDAPVRIQDESMMVEGRGLEAHPSLKEARLIKDVSADIAAGGGGAKKENRIQITCDGPMEVDQAKRRAIFRENVVAVELVSGRRMKSDMMEVHFDTENKKISEIICMGNVELQQGQNVTYSEMLVYRADEQRVVITGKPKLLIDAGNVDTQKVFQF